MSETRHFAILRVVQVLLLTEDVIYVFYLSPHNEFCIEGNRHVRVDQNICGSKLKSCANWRIDEVPT